MLKLLLKQFYVKFPLSKKMIAEIPHLGSQQLRKSNLVQSWYSMLFSWFFVKFIEKECLFWNKMQLLLFKK